MKTLAAVGFVLLGANVTQAASFTLEDLLYQAMQSYPTILAKQSQKDAAKTDLTAAKLKFLPNPSFNTQRNQVAYSGQPISNQPASTLQVSQPLWMGGSLIAGYNKADARLSAADYALLETREEVSKRIITAYAEWYKAHFKTIALEDNVRMHERFVSMIDRRTEGGVANGADRDLGYSRLHQARADLETQKSVERTSLETISQLVGQKVTRADLSARIARHVKLPYRTEGIEKAMAVSPAIHRYKFESDAAEAEAKEIRAQALPQVSFQAQRQVGNAYLPGAQGYDLYGLVVNYAPGGGFSSVASSSAAFDRARAATMQVEVSKRDLTDKLNAEYNEYEFNLQKRENLSRSAKLSGSISDSYDRQYLVGRKSWLDVMNAVREKAQQLTALADAEGNVIGSSRRLLVAIDGTSSFDNQLEASFTDGDAQASRYSASASKSRTYESMDEPKTKGSLAGLVIDGKKVKSPPSTPEPIETIVKPTPANQMAADSGNDSTVLPAAVVAAASGGAIASAGKQSAKLANNSKVADAASVSVPKPATPEKSLQATQVEKESQPETGEMAEREVGGDSDSPVKITIVGTGNSKQTASMAKTAVPAPKTVASTPVSRGNSKTPVSAAKQGTTKTAAASGKSGAAGKTVAAAKPTATKSAAASNKTAVAKSAAKAPVKQEAKATNSKQPANRKKA